MSSTFRFKGGQLAGEIPPTYESFVLGLEEEFEKSQQSEEVCQVGRDKENRAGCEFDKMWGQRGGQPGCGQDIVLENKCNIRAARRPRGDLPRAWRWVACPL